MSWKRYACALLLASWSSKAGCEREETSSREDVALIGDGMGSEARGKGLSSFFRSLDGDGDGQIREDEARLYIKDVVGGEDYDTNREVEEGARSIIQILDTPDNGDTVDESELARHLQHLLTNDKVVDWIVHGLNLPQYADNVRRSAITALDFPLLVSNESILREELGVNSTIHKSQILRGMRRQILGLGRVPSSPREVQCMPRSEGCIILSWKPPLDVGNPPVHSYLLQRKEKGDMMWKDVTKAPHTVLAHVDDQHIFPGHIYEYRIVSWGGHGHSDFGKSSLCTVPSPTGPGRGILERTVAILVPLEWKGFATLAFLLGGILHYLGISNRRQSSKTKLEGYRSSEVAPPPEDEAIRSAPLGSMQKNLSSSSLLNQSDEENVTDLHPTPGRATELQSANFDRPGAEAPIPCYQEVNGRSDIATSSCANSHGDPTDVFELSDLIRVAASEGYKEAYVGVHLHRCNYPGCHERWDRWYRLGDVCMRFKRHFCAGCQNVFCYKHTRISPHGTSGRCSLESKCYCKLCYEQLPPLHQAELERINKLPWSKLPPSPSGLARLRWQQAVLGAQWRSKENTSLLDLPDMPSTPPAASQRWRMAGSKLHAIQAFRLAGLERRNRQEEDLRSN